IKAQIDGVIVTRGGGVLIPAADPDDVAPSLVHFHMEHQRGSGPEECGASAAGAAGAAAVRHDHVARAGITGWGVAEFKYVPVGSRHDLLRVLGLHDDIAVRTLRELWQVARI